ncbi:Nucleoporin nup57 [Elasticomyces elasticus]|uniref:Nucleoporin nup57 n=1 Tax=Exophiala sideris TaxID=1016849 RepID=A0ABR0JG89_9EURO|nr:Nucleoporin nup57 [Elasticomyces elasticus]KAK5033187.1 Nucleoporin nup57 [Exophiala sideris]KAK5042313.1 Nucleoporin nup57 [Exophiala sideris]KAK5063731.1 Nucleoporin nup57 [Exophiala sideris]KAK5185580.1 Nucleoporin nup57 [Eurotiomycetes sp. CCFEE 6388]
MFGNSTATQSQPAKTGLFSFNNPSNTQSTNQSSPSPFGQPQAQTQQQQSNAATFGFGNPQSQPQQQPQQTGGLFGTSTQPQQIRQTGGLFGGGQPQQQQQQSGGGLFGAAKPQQQTGGLFGSSTQPQQQTGGLFGSSTQPQQQTGGLFGTSSQPQQQTGGLFGASTQPQQQTGGLFGTSTQPQQQQQQPQQRPLDQTLRFGQSQQEQTPSQAMWEEGRGLNQFRSIPVQMNIVKNKWDPQSLSSPLRTYLYQHVETETEALKYRPGPGEDEDKWEEAVSSRPGSEWVPLLIQGFFQLGRKAQIQMEAIQRCNMMLQEINTSLDVQLDKHRQNVATRLEECKRRQAATARRTLALAVKVQILRNRGYVMDNTEEELKTKLETLQREVFDPSLNAREQEVWARMLGIRERAKRIKLEMEKLVPAANEEDTTLDEETVKAAKKTLDAYDIQLRHLQKELDLIQQGFEDWEKISKDRDNDVPRRR